MEIHVARNKEKLGPYSPEEVRSRLAAGQLSGDDLGWREGLAQWVPLGVVMSSLPITSSTVAAPAIPVLPTPAPAPTPTAPLKKSGLAKASFIIGVVTSCVWLLVFVVIAITVAPHPDSRPADPFMILVGLALLANLLANLVGLILGSVVILKPIPNRWMAILGVAINSVEFLAMVFVMAIGLAHSRY